MQAGHSLNHIQQLIKKNGYISIARFMEEVVSTYYKTENSIGREGDFITSPEISQLFGEMIGIWCAVTWQNMGSPKNFALIELGSGRGTLLNDLLRSTKNIKGFHDAISIYIIENSPKFQKIQHQTLLKWQHLDFHWRSSFHKIPDIPTIVFSNEFFDALPIHQYVKVKQQWHENIITTLTAEGELCMSSLAATKNIDDLLNYEHPNAFHRSTIEMSPYSINILKHIANHINKNVGSCLIIDYGYNYPPNERKHYGPTLQAIKNHKYHPILKNVGNADITAHVDFFALSRAALDSNCNVFKILKQSEFLLNLGIEIRANMLIRNAKNEAEASSIRAGFNRLISPEQMGSLFKVLCFSNETLKESIGFSR